ncbi:MAG TPA: GYD domain-containing protein [Candidatus Binatia bacterium]|nr:GYD domain-containing protein [Candidatus Binatia bacterium]
MPHYVTLLRYTQQGIAKVQDSPKRLDAARKIAEKAGGRIHDWYLTMGRYDAVFISEFPDDGACARFSLSIASLGNVTTETLKAFTEPEYRKIMSALR